MKFYKQLSAILCAVLFAFTAVLAAACTPKGQEKGPDPETPVEYTVTFDLGCEGAAPAAQKVKEGELAAKPADPVREGYNFLCWCKDTALAEEFSFSEKIAANMTLHAKWELKQLTVQFDFNYTGAENVTETVKWGETVASKTVAPREGFTFGGWFTEAACVTPYDFTLPVKEDLHLYAQWTDVSKTYYEVTYHLNYPSAPAASSGKVEEGTPAIQPEDPERNGFSFTGWYREEGAETLYDFKTPVTGDLGLDAGGEEAIEEQELVIEAEYIDLEGIAGIGFSSNPEGIGLIQSDYRGMAGASNGFFVGSLYKKGLTLTFTFTSDRAVKGAELKLRLSGELIEQISLTQDDLEMRLNGVKLNFQTIVISGINTDMSLREKHPFADFVIGTGLELSEGENTVTLTVNNSNPISGMIKATAPMVDCLKVKAMANLSYDPITENLRDFE